MRRGLPRLIAVVSFILIETLYRWVDGLSVAGRTGPSQGTRGLTLSFRFSVFCVRKTHAETRRAILYAYLKNANAIN